ncbi:hypothetical protein QBC45DRAFT_464699 [Copromyces sp. CBS 386.78]|nr:hypothetical protein QBC45DRAFT_464699 [Copromyces sp. CBS 386.78]
MDPLNPPNIPTNPATRLRYIKNEGDLWDMKINDFIEKHDASSNQDPRWPRDCPGDMAEMVIELIDAMKNMVGITDNKPMTNYQVKFVNHLDARMIEEKAWDIAIETRMCEMGLSKTNVTKVEFESPRKRWNFIVATLRYSKAAVYNLFEPPYMERLVNNPTTELDMKISNLNTNAERARDKAVLDALKKYPAATFNEASGQIVDGNGNILKRFDRIEKRKLSDFLGPELAQHAKPKRHRTSKSTSKGKAVAPSNTAMSPLQDASHSPLPNLNTFYYDDVGGVGSAGLGLLAADNAILNAHHSYAPEVDGFHHELGGQEGGSEAVGSAATTNDFFSNPFHHHGTQARTAAGVGLWDNHQGSRAQTGGQPGIGPSANNQGSQD